MKENIRQTDSFKALEKALVRLKEALEENPETNKLAIDGTIQRFEFSLELFWKVMKKFLELEGLSVKSPKQILQEAFNLEWIHDEELWLNMLNDRNETSHSYNEEIAKRIYSHISSYYKKMSEVYSFLLKL